MVERMKGSRLVTIGSALADPTRASIIAALLSGTAHTSGELARFCGVAPSTMSSHLGKLLDAGLLRVEAAGRYRHYQIASLEVADLLEEIDSIDLPEVDTPDRPRPGEDLAYARSCYDHIAGRLGVDLYEAFLQQGLVVVVDESAELTRSGASVFTEFGIDVEHLQTLRRPLLRLDLDWTERRHHFAGSLPAAFLTRLVDDKWITRRSDKRQLAVTERGRKGLRKNFGLDL